MTYHELLRISMAYELGSAITPTSGGGGYIKLGMLVQKGFTPEQATSLMTLASLEHSVFIAVADRVKTAVIHFPLGAIRCGFEAVRRIF